MTAHTPILTPAHLWTITRDGDPHAYDLYSRHYTYRAYRDGRRNDPHNPNRRLFVGPGYKLVLITPAHDALFVWRSFRDPSGQAGINCAIFRNESTTRSSTLILAAQSLAWQRWPNERLYTYVNPARIRSSHPGCCFRHAGWRRCGNTTRGLIILELLPTNHTPHEDPK